MASFEAFKIKDLLHFTKNKEWKVFLICFIISSFLWFFQSLGRTYNKSIIITVEYTNLPKDKVFTTPLPNKFDVLVKGIGWDLLSYYLQINKPVFEIDLSQIGSQKQYSAATAKKLIVDQVPGLTDILSIQPEVIDLNLENAVEKKVPIEFKGNITYANGYGQSGGIILTPNEVVIRGPKSRLSTINSIQTDSLVLNNLTSPIDQIVKLDLSGYNFLHFDTNQVLAQAQIEELTEKQIQLPIKVYGYKGKKKVNLVPQVATITFQITLSDFSKVDKSDLTAYINFPSGNEDAEETLEIKVESNSKLAKNIKVSPQYIDYFLE